MSINYIGLLMYDLPMQTEEELREYQRFRKNIIGKGYYQLQKSVYIINSNTKERIEKIEKELIMEVPRSSSVRSLILTEEQLKKIKVISGQITIGEIIVKKNKILEY